MTPQATPHPPAALPSSPSTKYRAATHVPSESSRGEYTSNVLALANEYLLPVYARPDFVLSHGKGSYVWDTDGREYVDFSAGIAVNALGHTDKGVVKVSWSFLMCSFALGVILNTDSYRLLFIHQIYIIVSVFIVLRFNRTGTIGPSQETSTHQ